MNSAYVGRFQSGFQPERPVVGFCMTPVAEQNEIAGMMSVLDMAIISLAEGTNGDDMVYF